ncbi:hypothetical protein C8T65DRAFT_135151 [Cerioporus squamosus]|nr:hypothetical protein C8T65DRAFT_135151 [Cerioporus squamosus]
MVAVNASQASISACSCSLDSWAHSPSISNLMLVLLCWAARLEIPSPGSSFHLHSSTDKATNRTSIAPLQVFGHGHDRSKLIAVHTHRNASASLLNAPGHAPRVQRALRGVQHELANSDCGWLRTDSQDAPPLPRAGSSSPELQRVASRAAIIRWPARTRRTPPPSSGTGVRNSDYGKSLGLRELDMTHRVASIVVFSSAALH